MPLRRSIQLPSSAAISAVSTLAVVMRRDRREAAGADPRHAGALGLDAPPRLGGVGVPRRAPPRPARTWSASAPWAASGSIVSTGEADADPVGEPEPVETAGGEHERVEAALLRLAQARVDVAAQRLDRDRRIEREQLRAAPDRGGADPHARLEPLGADERVARVVALEVRAHGEAGRVGRGHVLGGVYGDVDPVGEQRLLELLHEDAALADLPERAGAVAVAGGRDRQERDLVAGPAQVRRASSACVSASREPREPTRMTNA